MQVTFRNCDCPNVNFVTVFRAQPADANELVLSLDFLLLFFSNPKRLSLFLLIVNLHVLA